MTRLLHWWISPWFTIYFAHAAFPSLRRHNDRRTENDISISVSAGSRNQPSQNGNKEGREDIIEGQHQEIDRELTDIEGCEPVLDSELLRIIDFENIDGGRLIGSSVNEYVLAGPTIVKAQKRGNKGYSDGRIVKTFSTYGDEFDVSHFRFLGFFLLISEDAFDRDLDDVPAAAGGKIVLTFPAKGVWLHSIRFIDTGHDGEKSEVTFYGGESRQERIKGFKIPFIGDGADGDGQKVVNMCTHVTQVEIDLKQGGAIDDIVFTIPPPATEDELCCDVAELAEMECPLPDGYARSEGFICCPDGSWGCLYAYGTARCVESATGVEMTVSGYDLFSILESDLATRTPICGGCESFDLETILSLRLPCPQLCNSDRLGCDDQRTTLTRDPLNNCEFPECPEVQCCNPLTRPFCYDTYEFCCADGNWTCFDKGPFYGGIFCGGVDVSNHRVESPVCDDCDYKDEMVCPNSTLVRRRDRDDDCNFQPCPEPPAKCCDPKDEPGRFDNRACGEGSPHCCRDGKWTCPFNGVIECDTDPYVDLSRTGTGGLVCGQDFHLH